MTLEKLANDTFYKMECYSQFVIDLVETIEDDISEMTKVEKESQVYLIQNVLSIIDENRTFDVEALKSLILILES